MVFVDREAQLASVSLQGTDAAVASSRFKVLDPLLNIGLAFGEHGVDEPGQLMGGRLNGAALVLSEINLHIFNALDSLGPRLIFIGE